MVTVASGFGRGPEEVLLAGVVLHASGCHWTPTMKRWRRSRSLDDAVLGDRVIVSHGPAVDGLVMHELTRDGPSRQ